MNQNVTRWAEQVTKASNGRVKVKVYWNTLGNALTVYDNIKNGVADADWVLQPLVRGKFPKTSIVELPGLFQTSEEASVVLWKLYENGTLKDEYSEIKPIATVPMTGNRIHTNKPIPDVASLAGKKYRVAGKTLGDLVSAFGGTGIQLSWTKIHQSLDKGVIQGTLSPWNDFVPAKFPEMTKYHLDHPFGMIAGLVAMNQKSYAALPADAKAAVDKVSGMAHVLWLSRAADKNMEENRAKVKAMKGHTVFTFSDAEYAKLKAKMQPVYDAWVKRTKGGAEMMAAVKKLMPAKK
jgi:TRAP-type C4-dicarboxylate transport system substrate-binding protein